MKAMCIDRGILWIENVLIKDGTFSLPGKKELLKNYMEYKIIAIDAAETSIERPKKNKNNVTREGKNNIH